MHMRKVLATLAVAGLLAGCATAPPIPVPPPSAEAPAPESPAPVLKPLHTLPQSPVPSLPQWSPDGQAILYAGPAGPDNPHGSPTIFQVGGQGAPRLLTMLPAFTEPIWHPGGKAVVFAGARQDNQGSATTLWQQPITGGDPTDLLPGDLARQSVSGTKWPNRWIAGETLAYVEHMGTGIQAMRLLNATARVLEPLPEGERLEATLYQFQPGGSRVAGQWYGGPPSFWLWDFHARRRLAPPEPLPGQHQFFEAWDGNDAVLFTAWDGGYPYSEDPGTATLYRWDLEGGRVAKVAESAVLAAAAGGRIAYVRLSPSPVLVVADTAGKVLWQRDLGPLPATGAGLWEFRPRPGKTGVLYQTGDYRWHLAPVAGNGSAATVHEGPARATAGFSPDERYIALLVSDIPPQLQIFQNPFGAQ